LPVPTTELYLAICAIFRDEAPYLAEWITFHQLVGVEHFFLYDNNSTDDCAAVLRPFITAGTVTLEQWPIPFHEKAQRQAYSHCLESVRGRVRWLACIDIDEFLFAPDSDNLAVTLTDYEAWPGVVVHWQNYGSAGRLEPSGEPVIERFPWRARTTWIRNRKVKSIVDPARTVAPSGVHHFCYVGGALAVDETKTPVRTKPRAPYTKRLKPLYARLGPLLRHIDPYSAANIDSKRICVERLRINHYPVKSYQECHNKMTLKQEKGRYTDIDYFAYHDRNEVYDTVIQRYLPALRQRLQAEK
jgi:Glycosyltransferase family 92